MSHRTTNIKWLMVLGIACVLSIPTQSVWGQDDANQRPIITGKTKKTGPWYKRFSASASLTTMVGAGSFAPSPSYQNHYFAQSLGLSLGYSIWKGLSASASWGLDWEYTRPDNASGRRVLPRDVNLSLGWSNPIEAMKKYLSHSISLNFQLPSSLLSQVQTRILRMGLGLSLGYSIKKYVRFNYSFGVNKSFHRYTSSIFDQGEGDLPSILLRQVTREGLDLPVDQAPVPGGKNISWMLSNTLTISFHPHKTVAIGISLGIYNGFKYPSPIDQFTPTIPTVDGDRQADSVGRIDFTVGDVYVSYQPIKYLGFSLGASSFQTPFTANNKGLRVPFFNFVTANDNTTTFYLRMSGSI